MFKSRQGRPVQINILQALRGIFMGTNRHNLRGTRGVLCAFGERATRRFMLPVKEGYDSALSESLRRGYRLRIRVHGHTDRGVPQQTRS